MVNTSNEDHTSPAVPLPAQGPLSCGWGKVGASFHLSLLVSLAISEPGLSSHFPTFLTLVVVTVLEDPSHVPCSVCAITAAQTLLVSKRREDFPETMQVVGNRAGI